MARNIKKPNYHFSKDFNEWYKSFLKVNKIKREDIFGDKLNEISFNGREWHSFTVQTLYEAFKCGQKSKEPELKRLKKFKRRVNSLQRICTKYYEEGDDWKFNDKIADLLYL